METPATALRRLRAAVADGRLAAVCRRHGVALLVVFGSAADPARAGAARDLDLAVLPRETGWDLVAFVADLTELAGLDDIDVVDLRRAGPVLRVEALHRGRVLHEQRPGTAARLEAAAITQQMETRWLRDWARRLMAA